jgi:non-ribosomal peptide synthetase component F
MYDPALIRTAADIPGVQARLRPDEAAFWFEGRTTTFAEVEPYPIRVANALIAAGVQAGRAGRECWPRTTTSSSRCG